jgi:hypothetical protein
VRNGNERDGSADAGQAIHQSVAIRGMQSGVADGPSDFLYVIENNGL